MGIENMLKHYVPEVKEETNRCIKNFEEYQKRYFEKYYKQVSKIETNKKYSFSLFAKQFSFLSFVLVFSYLFYFMM